MAQRVLLAVLKDITVQVHFMMTIKPQYAQEVLIAQQALHYQPCANQVNIKMQKVKLVA